jgi:hypothetical protein
MTLRTSNNRRTGALVLMAGVVGLAVGLPLGAVLFDDGGSDSRRSGSFSLLSPQVLSTTCEQRHLDFGGGAVLVETSAGSRFRLPGTGTVQARMIFYRDGAVLHTEAWAAPNYRAADGTYGHADLLAHQLSEEPDRVRAEWRVGKSVYPMFASC